MSPQADSFVVAMQAGWAAVDLNPSAVGQRFEERFGTKATSKLESRRTFEAIAGILEFAAA